uniref:Protein kinase domain-containing protein n=1 Tax=Oryza meridionalis TaxID=40149 RepID=A0A0E0CZH3_9ORYZ
MDIEAVLKLFVHTEENYPGFRKFDFIQIVDATDGFSEKRILGKGGFGTVYKGHLLDGLTVAIKTFDADTAIFDLKSELQLVRIQHTNLIRLLGWCIHEKERILVYEYIQKGSLHNIIFRKLHTRPLFYFLQSDLIQFLINMLANVKQLLPKGSWISLECCYASDNN